MHGPKHRSREEVLLPKSEVKLKPGPAACLPGIESLKRSQVCEEWLYMEALVLSVVLFPTPESSCQASLA